MKISISKALQFRLLFFLPPLIKEDRGLLPNLMKKEKTGYGLFIDENGCLSLEIGDGSQVVKISSEKKLLEKVWYLAVATFDAETKKVHLYQEPRVTSTNGGLGMAILNPLEETSASIESFSSCSSSLK